MDSPEATLKIQGQSGDDEEKLEAVVDLLLKVEGRWLPLVWAASDNHEAVSKLLLIKANLDAKGEDGQTPMLWAAANGYEEVIKLLLDAGKVELDAKDTGGQAPLLLAARNGHQGVVKLLLDTGKVDIDTRDEHGGTPLGGQDNGRTPFWLAAEAGHAGVMLLLRETGKINLDIQDKDGQTPLLLAANSGYDEVLWLLFETSRVDPNVKDKYGRTPLMWAAKNGHTTVAKVLLQTGKVDPDAQDRDGRTPLWFAAQNGYEEVAKLLLGTGKTWVLHFSKISDTRECGLISGITDEKIINQLENAVLDGSDVDVYLRHRTNRRDILMSVTMNMIWEYTFTRYLFGMSREQRQTLKELEKMLSEAGPPEAVRQWRAVTLTLLSKRNSFKRQRDQDTEAVVQAIFQTMCTIPSPPSQEMSSNPS
ncbi:hypothetical protein QQX98_004830 [Neonectria punicea]|uniref:Uncharacterized protein n=1 Tax=Neonectria punicea TaxID=979145 RepID=A0ABR1H7G1_9HYPO